MISDINIVKYIVKVWKKTYNFLSPYSAWHLVEIAWSYVQWSPRSKGDGTTPKMPSTCQKEQRPLTVKKYRVHRKLCLVGPLTFGWKGSHKITLVVILTLPMSLYKQKWKIWKITDFSRFFSKKLHFGKFWNYIPDRDTLLRREGGRGSKIRFLLFFQNQIFHLRWNQYFLQHEDIFSYAPDIVS